MTPFHLSLCWLLLALLQPPTTKAQRVHEGLKINFITEERLSVNVIRNVEEFQNITGAIVNVFTVPFSELFEQIFRDLRDGSPLYDGFVFVPAFLVDFIKCDGCSLEILTERVRDSDELAWQDVSPYFRSHNSVFDGKVYMVTLDGDIHYLYYNLDILEALNSSVPTTWDEYLEISELANGRDWNGDGEPDFGSCIVREEHLASQFFLLDVVSSYMQSKGSKEGVYFDIDTMEPLLKTEGFREGLDMYMRLRDFGPPLPTIVEVFRFMAQGRCAFAPTWASVGPMSRDTRGTPFSTWDKIGAAITPGSTRVWDHKKDRWLDCEDEPKECPSAKDGVNHAPFAAGGGWSGAIPVNVPDNRKDAAFDFLAFLGSKSDETVMAGQGFDPYRTSHFDLDLWVNSGFNEKAARAQIAGLRETQNSPNLVVDLRIQGSNELLEVLFTALAELNADEITQDQLIDRVYSEWQRIIDDLGRRDLLQQYRATLSLPPKDFAAEVEVTEGGRIALAVVAGLFILCCIGLFIFVFVHEKLKVWRYASPLFLYGSLIGAILAYVGITLMSAYPSTGTCTSALWLYVVGMSLLLGNIFAKTYRTWRLFINSDHFFLAKIRDSHILPISAFIMLLAVVILVVWTIMDPPSDYKSTKGVGDLEFVVICDSPDHGLAFFATTIAYFGILLLVALFLSFNTRNVGDAFNESKVLTLCVYNLTQVLIIVVVCVLALDDPSGRFVLVVICFIFGVSVTIGLLFLPKVWKTLRGKGNQVHTVKSSKDSARSRSSAKSSMDSARSSKNSKDSARSANEEGA